MAGPILKPRVRETSTTTGTGNIFLLGAMRGSLAFSEVMSVGDTCDICISYDNAFEECAASLQGDGSLFRGTVYQSRHANGTVDTNHVNFAAGVKTVIQTFGSGRLNSFLTGAVRFDQAQALSAPQKRQALDNLGLLPTGTKMLFIQAAAPPGWTIDATHNDKALRIVNSSGGGSGGSSNFSTVFGKQSTDGSPLSQAHLPVVNFNVTIPAGQGSHRHIYGKAEGGAATQAGAGGRYLNEPVAEDDLTAFETLPAMTGTAASGGSGSVHAHFMDIRVRYVDGIICNKD